MSDISIYGLKTSGTLAKSISNAQHSLNCNGDVVVRDCTFGQDGYNCLEIGLQNGYNPKNVLIENCTFEGTLSNNAILVFGTQNDAVITIRNCHFKSVSNGLRLSNKTNATNVVVNLENCTCDSWEGTPAYAGFILLQDYTTKYTSASENPATANLFAPEKITINFKNCYGPQGKIMGSVEDICGSGIADKQVIYVYANYEKEGNKAAVVPFGDGSRYPTVHFE